MQAACRLNHTVIWFMRARGRMAYLAQRSGWHIPSGLQPALIRPRVAPRSWARRN